MSRRLIGRDGNANRAVNRRDLARIRRSEQRKSLRHELIDNNRDLGGLVQLDAIEGPSNAPPPPINDPISRKAHLQRWKAEKTLMLKLQKENDKTRPPFKPTGKIVYDQPKFLNYGDFKIGPVKQSQASKSTFGVVTRSMAASKQLERAAPKSGTVAANLNDRAVPLQGKRDRRMKLREKVELAPSNYMFVPPDGVQSFQLEPLPEAEELPDISGTYPGPSSAASANMSFTRLDAIFKSPKASTEPSEYGTPSSNKFNMENVTLTRGSGSRKKRREKKTFSDDAVAVNRDFNPEDGDPRIVVDAQPIEASTSSNNNSSILPVLSTQHFEDLVSSATEKLRTLSQKWNEIKETEEEINEDAIGLIMTTVGQTDILISSKFKQFSGLVDDCKNGGEQLVTVTDLQGFWEMVYYQVEDVVGKFGNLEKLRSNNWIVAEEIVAKPPKKLRKKILQAASNRHAASARKRIAEARAKALALKQAHDSSIVTQRRSVRCRRSSSLVQTSVPDVKIEPLIPLQDDNLTRDGNTPKSSKNLADLFSPLSTTEETCRRGRSTNLMRFSQILSPAEAKDKENSLSAYLVPMEVDEEGQVDNLSNECFSAENL